MDNQQQKQLKVFGFGLPLILVVLGIRHGLKHSWDILSFCLFLTAVVVLGIALGNRPLLVKIFKIWMKVAHTIGIYVTGTILVILYIVIFTPTSWVLKLRGRDFMCRDWIKDVNSYWVTKKNSDQQSYTQQF